MIKKISKIIAHSIKTRCNRTLSRTIKPRFIEFDITKHCNSRCKYCDIWKGEKKGKDMTLEEIEEAFADKIMSDVKYIIITGGEPTLRKDLKQVYHALHRTCPKAVLQLSTNGLLKDRVIDIVNDMMSSGIRFDVGISIDGIGKKHDEIRGIPGNFKIVNELIDELLIIKAKHPKLLGLCLGMTISDLTVDEYPKIKEYADKKGLELIHAWVEQTPYYDNKDKVIDVKKDRIKEIVDRMPESLRKEYWKKDIKGESIMFDCYALDTFLVVRFDGGIAPCLKYYDKIVGNIKCQDFTAILSGTRSRDVKNDTVRKCDGCLNTWAFAESHMAKLTPYAWYYLKHPRLFWKENKEDNKDMRRMILNDAGQGYSNGKN